MHDNTSSLTQLHKLIRSLRKQEIEQIQQIHGDALKQIATIAKHSNLTLEHIQIAMSVRPPKEKQSERIPRKNKKKLENIATETQALDPNIQ